MTRGLLFALASALPVALVCLPACAQPDPAPTPMAVPEPLPPPPPAADGPGVDTLFVDGEAVPMNTAPYETPLGFPLPFTTRLPEGFEAESVSSREGDAVVLTAPDADRASLRIFLPADAGLDAAAAAAFAKAEGAPEPMTERPAWSRASFQAVPAAEALAIHLTRHADRPVFVILRFPDKSSPGTVPRLGYILDRIRWADTGRLLIDG